jgi:hypothetical protein
MRLLKSLSDIRTETDLGSSEAADCEDPVGGYAIARKSPPKRAEGLREGFERGRRFRLSQGTMLDLHAAYDGRATKKDRGGSSN